MAIQNIFEIQMGQSSLRMEYNDVNLRVGSLFFTVPAGINAAVKLWDNGALVLDTSYSPGSYENVVPGNYRVIETVDPEDGSINISMPSEIAWNYSEIKP